ncbi:MAG: exopolysaccharide biosynthesis protein [Amphiplicatus sp.]
MRDRTDARPAPSGATRLLRDILADLERRAETRQPEMAPARAGAPTPDETAKEAEASLGDVMERLDERAFGVLFLLLALPCTLPFVYVLPQIVSLPMLALAAQMAFGRKTPWLPRRLAARRFSIPDLQRVLARSEKYVAWFERLARPRLRPVTGHGAARFVGAILLVPIASILVPFPGTNTVPGIGVAIAALGLIERDGVLVILGLLIGVAWVVLLLVLGLEAAELLKAWLVNRL